MSYFFLSTFDLKCQAFTDCTLVPKGTWNTLIENLQEEKRKKKVFVINQW